MPKFLFELEDEIEKRIVENSTMPFVTIQGQTLMYDEFCNHIPKKIKLEQEVADIVYTIKNSEKLYCVPRENFFILAMDDGSNIIYYSSHAKTEVEIVEVGKIEREKIDRAVKMSTEEVAKKITDAIDNFGKNQEAIFQLLQNKIERIVDSGVKNVDDELLTEIAIKLRNDSFAYHMTI